MLPFVRSGETKQHLFMFFMFQFQGGLIVLLSMPIVAIATNTQPTISINEICGALLCLIGFVGEAIADEQMRQFKSNKIDYNKTCDIGLWRYSRQP